MSMNVLMVLTAVTKFVLTLLEATLVPVTLAIAWHLIDKCVMVSPFLVPKHAIRIIKSTFRSKSVQLP